MGVWGTTVWDQLFVWQRLGPLVLGTTVWDRGRLGPVVCNHRFKMGVWDQLLGTTVWDLGVWEQLLGCG